MSSDDAVCASQIADPEWRERSKLLLHDGVLACIAPSIARAIPDPRFGSHRQHHHCSSRRDAGHSIVSDLLFCLLIPDPYEGVGQNFA
jgi:hypothetical protein